MRNGSRPPQPQTTQQCLITKAVNYKSRSSKKKEKRKRFQMPRAKNTFKNETCTFFEMLCLVLKMWASLYKSFTYFIK